MVWITSSPDDQRHEIQSYELLPYLIIITVCIYIYIYRERERDRHTHFLLL